MSFVLLARPSMTTAKTWSWTRVLCLERKLVNVTARPPWICVRTILTFWLPDSFLLFYLVLVSTITKHLTLCLVINVQLDMFTTSLKGQIYGCVKAHRPYRRHARLWQKPKPRLQVDHVRKCLNGVNFLRVILSFLLESCSGWYYGYYIYSSKVKV